MTTSSNASQQLQIKNILYSDIPFITQFKTINEVLTGILRDATWSFNAPDLKCDPDKPAPFAGLEIAANDSNKSIFLRIKMDLNVNKILTNYYCKMAKHDIGIHLEDLFKILKIVNKTDKVSISIAENDRQRLIVTAEGVTKEKRYWQMNLREPNQKHHQLTVKDFKYRVTMKNEKFHTICREMAEFSEHLEIKCTANSIVFTCIGDNVGSSYIYHASDDGITIECKNEDKPEGAENEKTEPPAPYIYQGIFELKSLKLFSKCSSLGQNIAILLINGFPITMEYNIGSGLSAVILLSPKIDQCVNNVSFNYNESDEESDDEDVVVGRPKLK